MYTDIIDTMQRGSSISFPFLGNLTLNPPASFSFLGREIYFYGVIIACAFIVATLYCAKKSPKFGLTEDDVYDVIIWLIPFSILGARLYYVAFEWEYYAKHLNEVFAIWNGGLAIYGGIIAGILVVILVCRIKKKPPLAMIDLIVFGLLIGQAMGRWGNFMNREAFGTTTDIFCKMGLTDASGNTVYVHPTFLYESFWNVIGFIWLTIWSSKKGNRKYDGQVILLYFVWYGIGRGWIEGLRTDSLYIGNTGIRVSQALSICLAAAAWIVLMVQSKKVHTPDEVYYNVVNGADACVIVPAEEVSEVAEDVPAEEAPAIEEEVPVPAVEAAEPEAEQSSEEPKE